MSVVHISVIKDKLLTVTVTNSKLCVLLDQGYELVNRKAVDQLIQENIQLKEEKMQFLEDVKLQPSWTLLLCLVILSF